MQAYQRILVPVDFTPITEAILARARELSTCYKAQITLLYVLGDVPLGDSAFSNTDKLPVSAELKQKQIDTATDKLHNLVNKNDLQENTTVEVVYTKGKASEAITNYVKQKKIDLVIVGNSGKKSVLGFLGSTAEATLKTVTCDIMAVRLTA